MQVKDVMTRDVQMIQPHSSLQEAAELLKILDVGSLLVGDGDRLAGIITDRDIAVRAVAEGRDPEDTLVRDVMTPDLVCCFADDELEEAARLMQETQLRRLLVIDDERHLVGIVSLADIVLQTGDDGLAGHTLERITEPSE